MTALDWVDLAQLASSTATVAALAVAIWSVTKIERTENKLQVQQHLFEHLRLFAQNADLFETHPILDPITYRALSVSDRARADMLALYSVFTCDLLFQVRDRRAQAYLRGLDIHIGALSEMPFDSQMVRSPEVLARWNAIRVANGAAPLSRMGEDWIESVLATGEAAPARRSVASHRSRKKRASATVRTAHSSSAVASN
jgi:hypothetical protein